MSSLQKILDFQRAEAQRLRDRIEAMERGQEWSTARQPFGDEIAAMVEIEKARLEPIERHIDHLEARLAREVEGE